MNLLRSLVFNRESVDKKEIFAVDGAFYLDRKSRAGPQCLFHESRLVLKATSEAHEFELIINRILDEDDVSDDEPLDTHGSSPKSLIFDVSENIKFHMGTQQSPSLKWRSTEGDLTYEFVFPGKTPIDTVNLCQQSILECIYENKFRACPTPGKNLNFLLFKESPNPKAVQKPRIVALDNRTVPKSTQCLELDCEFFVFNASTAEFDLQLSKATCELLTTKSITDSYLTVKSDYGHVLLQELNENTNHSFHLKDLAFVWNYLDQKNVCYSLCLKFLTNSEFAQFRKSFTELHMQATLHLSIQSMKLKDNDIDYIMGHAESEGWTKPADNLVDISDSDEEPINSPTDRRDSNSLLAVSKQNTFVVRGNNVGVFGFANNGKLRYRNTIGEIKFNRTPINPEKLLLSNNDEKMLIVDKKAKSKIYQLDVNTETIVNEWSVDPREDSVEIKDVSHKEKGSDGAQFVGVSQRALFNIDTRASAVVDWQGAQSYATNPGFKSAATTENGAIAVGSAKGELRLFDRVGIRAKTSLQGAPEPIHAVDVSADGRYVLATCSTCLMLYDVALVTAKGETTTAFSTRMPAEGRPQSIRLALRAEHVAMLGGRPQQFTKGTFNTSDSMRESFIATSTGPYAVSWKLSDVLAGRKDQYVLKKFACEVVGDAFRHGEDALVIALPGDVRTVSAKSLHTPAQVSRRRR